MAQQILLVGHCSISRTYIEALNRLPEVVIAGVVGRSAERAAAFARKQGIVTYGTYITGTTRLTAETAAVICTPNAPHYDHVLESAASVLHCLCEKPLHIHSEHHMDSGEMGRILSADAFIKHYRSSEYY